MTAPNRGPRPVGPPPPPWATPPPSPGRPGPGAPPPGAGVPPPGTGPTGSPWPSRTRVYTWTSRGRPFPAFGIALLVIGVGLLITLLVPDLSFGSLLVFALGVAAAAAWLMGGVTIATVPALVLLGWGLAGIGSDLGYLAGDGWGSLFIGIGLLIAWGLGRSQGARREWALVVGIVLGAIGLAEVADSLPFDADLAVIIPLAMIAIGVYLIARDRVPART